MQIRNTRQSYGLIAIILHWTIAFGFLASYVSLYYREWFTEAKTPENLAAMQIHTSVGVTIAALVLLRIVWKLMNIKPEKVSGGRLENAASRTMHLALYAMIVLMPITGYLGTSQEAKFLFLFDVPKFEDTAIFHSVVESWMGMTFSAFKKPVHSIHNLSGETIVWWLIVLHIAAALYHHVVRKDVVLTRMLVPLKRTR